MQPDSSNDQDINIPTTGVEPVEFGAVAVDSTLQQDEPVESQDGPANRPEVDTVQWQAAEYSQYVKQPIWYVGFGVVVVALIAVALLMNAWTFAVLIPVMAAALLVYAHRPPAIVNYTAGQQGLTINGKLHPLGEFRAFGVRQEGDNNLLMLIPVKRFRPGVVVNFPREVGEQLVDSLGAYLPMQEVPADFFDRLIRKLNI